MELALIMLLGIAAPFGIALFNKVKWSSKTKQLVAFGFSIVLAFLWLFITGGLDGFTGVESIAVVIPSIYALSQIVYEFIFKNVLSKLEAATHKDAVVVIPDLPQDGLVVTSSETVKVSEVSDASANVPVSEPILIETQETPRG